MRKLCLLLTAAVCASPAAAFAQTRFVTAEIAAGTVNVDATNVSPDASFDLSGPGFHFVSNGVEPGAIAACLEPCTAGESFTLAANFSGTYLGTGMAVVGSEALNPAVFTGSLVIETGPLTIPRGNRKRLVMSVPFTLGRSAIEPFATLGAWLEVPVSGGEPWMVATLTGSGTATAFFEREHYRDRKGLNAFGYDLVRVIYSFNINTPSTTE